MCRSVVGAAAGGRVRAGAHALIREHRAPQPVHAASGLRRLDPSRVLRLHLHLRRLDLLARRRHARCAARYTRSSYSPMCATFRTVCPLWRQTYSWGLVHLDVIKYRIKV